MFPFSQVTLEKSREDVNRFDSFSIEQKGLLTVEQVIKINYFQIHSLYQDFKNGKSEEELSKIYSISRHIIKQMLKYYRIPKVEKDHIIENKKLDYGVWE